MQVKIKDNIYFQQEGNFIVGTYVNHHFLKIEVDHELSEEELTELGANFFDLCNKYECVKNVISECEIKYRENPNFDLGW